MEKGADKNFKTELVSEAKQVGLSLTWSQTPEDRFTYDEAQFFLEFSLCLSFP